MPRLVGSGFIIATSPQAALVISAKHVFTEGVLKAQRPIPGHAPSAIFIHPKDLDPSLEPDWLKAIYVGGTIATMLNAIHLNYNDSLDLAARGGSACLDSFCQFISGTWRCAPTRQWAVQVGCHSTRDRACVRQGHDAA